MTAERCWCGRAATTTIQHRVYDRDEAAGYRADLPVCGRHDDPERWPDRIHDMALTLALTQGARLAGDEATVMADLDERYN